MEGSDQPGEVSPLEDGSMMEGVSAEAASLAGHLEASKPSGGGDAVEVSDALTAANHFGHRETDDIVVDLFWSRTVGDQFRVQVEDRREHVRFVLCPTTGKEAIQAFYHPFAVATPVLERVA